MNHRLGYKRKTRLWLRHYVVPFLILFAPPPIAAAVSATSPVIFGLRASVYREIAPPFILLTLTSLFSAIAAYSSSTQGEVIESTKFFLMGCCLLAGTRIRTDFQNIQRLALLLMLLVASWYLLAGGEDSEASRGLLYPPDNNGSAIILYFLSLIVVENKKLFFRFLMMGLLFAFSMAVDSRTLLLLLPLLLLSQPISLSASKILALLAISIIAYFWATSVELFGNWSDQVRLALYSTVLNYFASHGIDFIAAGQTQFINTLNHSLPSFVAARLEVDHAHNAFFHILGSYGLLALLCFIGAIYSLFRQSTILRDQGLKFQIVLLFALMQIETVITDSRITYVIFLFFGLQLGMAIRNKALRPILTHSREVRAILSENAPANRM